MNGLGSTTTGHVVVAGFAWVGTACFVHWLGDAMRCFALSVLIFGRESVDRLGYFLVRGWARCPLHGMRCMLYGEIIAATGCNGVYEIEITQDMFNGRR